MKSPVLMIVFCRPDTTEKVLESVRNARPPKLYVAADAPRSDKPGEEAKCRQVLNLFDKIDWPCEVHFFRQQKNLGCSKGPYEAISWFFEHEEEGIILEDDIVPIPSFFTYCDEMLERYRKNEKIQSISGWSYFYNDPPKDYQYSYYYSKITSSWGWATWRRAWKDIDLKLENISRDVIKARLTKYGFPRSTKKLYLSYFDRIRAKYDALQSWDYQFLFSMWIKDRYVIQPIHSMTMNIGFTEGATHRFNESISRHPTKNIYPIKYPSNIDYLKCLDLIRIKNEKLFWHSKLYWKFFGLIKKIGL